MTATAIPFAAGMVTARPTGLSSSPSRKRTASRLGSRTTRLAVCVRMALTFW